MAAEGRLAIEIVYARPQEQVVIALDVPAGTTAGEAVERSGLAARFPEVAGDLKLGIFGSAVTPDTPLSGGDRVEIYRPLTADPKQARRGRAGGSMRVRR
jgi:putative ubiquitin-RnfH superfamily antitoxin RatB of RatAB toxin-antitoxin module